jgi:hypothetical protein
VATINTYFVWPIDDDVRDVRVIQKSLQRARTHEIVAKSLHELERREISDDNTFMPEGLSHTRQCRLATVN